MLLAAGGTGGHVYPAIAIADALRKLRKEVSILFVGTRDRMEWSTVPKSGYDIKSIWISGFHRRLTIQNFLFPLKLFVSLIQSFVILRQYRPDVVVACGGFASGPIGWMAAKTGIILVLQEQNSFPGVTNRMLAKQATTIFTAFKDAQEYFPADKVKLAGNPVRSKLEDKDLQQSLKHFNFNADKPVLLILGGSGGALALNNVMQKELSVLHNELNLQIIWQCGEKYLDEISEKIDTKEYPNLRLLDFIDDMAAAYGAADLVITRAGASTCSELMTIGKPAVLVPSPNVAGNHQEMNAKSMAEAGAAEILKENNLDEALTETVQNLIANDKKLAEMSSAMKKLARPNAAKDIAEEIYTLAEQNRS